MEEIWKDIEDYEGFYQISTHGRGKSLKRKGRLEDRILKLQINVHGYYYVVLCNGKRKTHRIHQLVAMAFLNHTPCGHKLVVDHKDFDRKNNRRDNLRIITQRENTNQKHLKSSSKYTGVTWVKASNKWISRIGINGKQKYLGLFVDELEASRAYKKALKSFK